MPAGYDRRQPTRDSFALEPAAPSQTRAVPSGQSRGAQIIGGESQGGAVAAGPQTEVAPVAAGLGQFVEQFMRPHLERRQQEEFAAGFARAASGAAIDELHSSNGPAARIFGPAAYEEGAAAFTAKKNVEQWFANRYADMDALQRLDPEAVGQLYTAGMGELHTGNALADDMTARAMMEGFGPLASTIAKNRAVWLKGEAVRAWSGAASVSARNLQSAAVAQAALSDPSDDETGAFAAQARAFLGGMAKPEGMDDPTYAAGLVSFMRGAMQDGNFYAVRLMREAGIDAALGEDDRIKLEDAEHRYSQRTLEDFTSTDPEFSRMAMDYERDRVDMRLGLRGSKTPLQMAQQLGAMNAYVRTRTGVDRDVFDIGNVRSEVRSLSDLVASFQERAQARAWQIEDRNATIAARREEKAEDVREAAVAAGVAWAAGDITGHPEVPVASIDALAIRDFRAGNLEPIARAFRVSHFVSTSVKNDIQAGVEGSIDQQYGRNFQQAHVRWQAMYKANPGMTAAYYGDWHEKMRVFDNLRGQLGPEAAFTRAFGDTARYSNARLAPESRKTGREAIAATVAARQPSWWNPWGGPSFTPDAVNVMQNVLEERVAQAVQNSDVQPGVIARESLDAALADGSLQVAGGQAWRTAKGTRPFRERIGVQQDEADEIFDTMVDTRLRRAGFQAGTKAHLDIHDITLPSGAAALRVIARDDAGHTGAVTIGIPDFKAAAGNRARSELEGNQPSPAAVAARQAARQGLDPNRRIRGEKGWERVRRINLETKYRGLPRARL